jgi:hypothetical protein
MKFATDIYQEAIMGRNNGFRRFFMVLSLAILLLAACGPAKTPAAGQDTPFANACDKANDGKNMAVEGYLRFPESFTGSTDVILRLYETDNYDGSPVGVETNFGTQANQVKMVSDQYADSDLTVYLADGSSAPFGTKVKVSGYVYFPLVGQDFACGLSTPFIELAQ